MYEEISNIEITDEDIDAVENLLGDVKFDEERRVILKCMDSADIQAYPGTGKTTVLVAKLAILAQKWPYANKGICVLSHTNVARNEIESRLGNTEIGKKLLAYPHFIGTIHSFFDRFAGSIWLKSNNYPITLIDTEMTLNRRYKKLSWTAKSYFEHKGLSYYNCESKSFPEITVDIGCKNKNAKSYRNVCSIIEHSFQEGYYTFDEILDISRYAINQYNWLPAALQERFPMLFIDEAQDTDESQWMIIKQCFPDDGLSVRQSYGDANQEIFRSYGGNETNTTFPAGNIMNISSSHRFGRSIAHLANPLGIISGLEGGATKFEHLDLKHTIFLFDEAKRVLPAYGELLLSCFTDNELNGNFPCYAVGMVHSKETPETEEKKYPFGVKDYYPAYNPDASKLSYTPHLLIEFFRLGQYLFGQTGNYNSLLEKIADGIRKYIRINSDIQISSHGSAFNSLLNLFSEDKKKEFRHDLHYIVKLETGTPEAWSIVVTRVQTLLKNYFAIQKFDDSYFGWQDDALNISESGGIEEKGLQNVFTYEKSDRAVQIHLSSIHAVKGKTHLATLVLDTFWKKRNIKSIVPFLSGCEKLSNKTEKDQLKRAKCHYVALTRAKGLICIAAKKDSLSESDIELLKNVGWNFVDV